MDLLDFFRGRRPWGQLLRFADRLPPESHYKTAVAMDPDVAALLAGLPEGEAPAKLTPLGYSPLIARLDAVIDGQQEMHATLAVMTQLLARRKQVKRPPVRHQPRPVTAIEEARKRAEVDEMRAVADVWFQR